MSDQFDPQFEQLEHLLHDAGRELRAWSPGGDLERLKREANAGGPHGRYQPKRRAPLTAIAAAVVLVVGAIGLALAGSGNSETIDVASPTETIETFVTCRYPVGSTGLGDETEEERAELIATLRGALGLTYLDPSDGENASTSQAIRFDWGVDDTLTEVLVAAGTVSIPTADDPAVWIDGVAEALGRVPEGWDCTISSPSFGDATGLPVWMGSGEGIACLIDADRTSRFGEQRAISEWLREDPRVESWVFLYRNEGTNPNPVSMVAVKAMPGEDGLTILHETGYCR